MDTTRNLPIWMFIASGLLFLLAGIALFAMPIFTVYASAEEVNQAMEKRESVVEGLYYDVGGAVYDEASQTLTFVASGLIQHPALKEQYAPYETEPDVPLDAWYNVFEVPSFVQKIVIAPNVTVTGRFVFRHDCVITGESRDTSIIYGTDEQCYSHNRGDAYDYEWDVAWRYSSIDVVEAATVYVENLTVQNPYGYCISGYAKGAVIHCRAVNMLDTRGGDQNNSDGFVGQAGSSLTDVYIATGDDGVKAYHDMTLRNVTIKMLTNGAPIQFGWNADDNEDTTVDIDGLTIFADEDIRYHQLAVFSWVSTANTKVITVRADHVTINTPKAKLFELKAKNGTLHLTLTNAEIHTREEGRVLTQGVIAISLPEEK